MWSEDGIFSKVGTCRVFDEKSDGTVRGAGYVCAFASNRLNHSNHCSCGYFLLKRKSDLKPEDKVLAMISGWAMNNDGDRKVGQITVILFLFCQFVKIRQVGISAPSIPGQRDCLVQAHRMANLAQNQLQYIECHGTGTNLGDPIEIQVMCQKFATWQKLPF